MSAKIGEKSGVRSQKTEDRGQRLEVRGEGREVREWKFLFNSLSPILYSLYAILSSLISDQRRLISAEKLLALRRKLELSFTTPAAQSATTSYINYAPNTIGAFLFYRDKQFGRRFSQIGIDKMLKNLRTSAFICVRLFNISMSGMSPFGDFLFYALEHKGTRTQVRAAEQRCLVARGSFPPVTSHQPPSTIRYSLTSHPSSLISELNNSAGGHNCLYSTGSYGVCSPAFDFAPLEVIPTGRDADAFGIGPLTGFRADTLFTSTGSVKQNGLPKFFGRTQNIPLRGAYFISRPAFQFYGADTEVDLYGECCACPPYNNVVAPPCGDCSCQLSGDVAVRLPSHKSSHSNAIATMSHSDATATIWQWNYYEHVIRNEKALSKIRNYIQNTPEKEKYDWNKLEAL